MIADDPFTPPYGPSVGKHLSCVVRTACSCGGCLQRPAALRGFGRRALVGAALAAAAMPSTVAAASATGADLTPDRALQLLRAGNDLFMARNLPAKRGGRRDPPPIESRTPFCVLVSCPDDWVSPELLFGYEQGELFVVNGLGNAAVGAVLGSVEYGVAVLGCPLVVVLGHEGCDAVAATVEEVEQTLPGAIGEPIVPAVLSTRRRTSSLLDDAVRANVTRVAAGLKAQSVVVQDALHAGRVKVVAARHTFDDSRIEWFEAV